MQHRSSTQKPKGIDTVLNVAELRCKRLADLKDQIEREVYKVSSQELVDKLLHAMLQNHRTRT